MNLLQQIEQTYGFQYPKLYHRLYEDGMLNMGAKYPYHSYCPIEYKNGDRLPNKKWLEQEYPKLKENPPLFLYVDWFQVLTPSQLAKEFEFLNQHLTQYPQNQKVFFAPFARAVVDDYMVYCFCYNKEKPTQEPSVVFIREDGEVDILSGNLQNFIFYQLIKRSVAHFHDISFICYGDFYENLRQTLRTHRPYLTEEQAEVLEDIYKREIREYTRKLTSGGCYTFLTLLHEGEEEMLLNKYNPLPKETILLKTV